MTDHITSFSFPVKLAYPQVPRCHVGLSKECVSVFEELKLGKKIKYIIYKLGDGAKEIVVEKKSENGDYEDFIGDLPEAECRYAIYDFEFELAAGEGTRNKICFYAWSPDDAPVRSKMVYASSKDALRRSLQGIQAEIQGTDFSEISHETVLGRFVGKKPV
ncbi:cofilin [Maublancomyces gigas]|uniref:Cofilin n=1 Tax=Discina gigas TaxID=1032678 RepID=A0ABR3GHX5_9PEZI